MITVSVPLAAFFTVTAARPLISQAAGDATLADSLRVRAVEQAGLDVLGPEFDALLAEGSRLGDSGAVALARRATRVAG